MHFIEASLKKKRNHNNIHSNFVVTFSLCRTHCRVPLNLFLGLKKTIAFNMKRKTIDFFNTQIAYTPYLKHFANNSFAKIFDTITFALRASIIVCW